MRQTFVSVLCSFFSIGTSFSWTKIFHSKVSLIQHRGFTLLKLNGKYNLYCSKATIKPHRGFILLNGKKDDDDNDKNDFISSLMERVKEMRNSMYEHDIKLMQQLSPEHFVRNILVSLRDSDAILADSGLKFLLKYSTPKWKRKIFNSIGAPYDASDEIAAQALGAAIGRPNNQYGILVNESDGDFMISFSSDIVALDDSSCWVECRFINPKDGSLLVMTGWELELSDDKNFWLIDRIDWQDFRDTFRPGIGREEWMRSLYG